MFPPKIRAYCGCSLGCLLVFLYIYNICFAFLPSGIRTRMIIGGIGVIHFLFQTIKSDFHVNGHILWIILLQGLYVLCNVLSSVLNSSFDMWFCQFAILNIIYLVGAMWICKMFIKYFSSFDRMLCVIIGCITVHNIVAFIAFIEPSVGEVVLRLQGDAELDVINAGVRAVGLGIGNNFFGGVITAFGEIALMYLISNRQIRTFPGLVVLVIMAATGIFIARTSLIGILVGLLFFNSRPGNLVKIAVYTTLIITAVYLVYCNYMTDTVNIKWAFEIFLNYEENGSFETYSTNSLMDMWGIIPSGVTWIWGDGQYSNPDGTFYMHTDIGYMRVIFGIGVLGLLCEFINYCYLFRVMDLYSNQNKRVRRFTAVAIVLLYILYVKGHTQLYFFFFLCVGTLYAAQTRRHRAYF